MPVMEEIRTDKRVEDLREQMNERFDRVDREFSRFDADVRELRGEMRSMQRAMLYMTGVMVTGFVGIAGLQAF